MTLWVYISPTVKRGTALEYRFIPVTAQTEHRGFRSVYLFTPNGRATVLENGSFKGLRTLPVVATELFLDFDNNPTAALACGAWLRSNKISHSKWLSGNRSVHYHVSTERIEGIDVPYSQRVWVSQQFPKADVSLYNVSGLWRLPWTWHEKNPGHRKELEYKWSGTRLNLPLVQKPVRLINRESSSSTDRATIRLNLAINDLKYEGGRRVHAWRIAALAYDAGFSHSQALTILREWNRAKSKPLLEDWQLETKLQEAWEQRAND